MLTCFTVTFSPLQIICGYFIYQLRFIMILVCQLSVVVAIFAINIQSVLAQQEGYTKNSLIWISVFIDTQTLPIKTCLFKKNAHWILRNVQSSQYFMFVHCWRILDCLRRNLSVSFYLTCSISSHLSPHRKILINFILMQCARQSGAQGHQICPPL